MVRHEPGKHETMRVVVFTPASWIFDDAAHRLVGYGTDGAFGLLPGHVDYTAPLVPGILTITGGEGDECFIALDGGVLLKIETTVRVATRRAVVGDNLQDLRRTVTEEFMAIDQRERDIRNAAARLEAGIVRRFIDIEE